MRRTRLGFIGGWLCLAMMASACGGGEEVEPSFPEGSFAIVANADVGTGASRVLVAIAQEDGTRLGSPNIGIQLTARPLDAPGETSRATGVFTWMVEDVVGLYRAAFEFDRPGTWEITVQPSSGPPLAPVAVNVLEKTLSPNIGDPAPVAPTPTLADSTLAELTTDPTPEPRFYATSLEDALASGKPTVLVFSTPAYCQTAACGPLLDTVKGVAVSYPDVNFIHVEVYTGLTDPDFVPDPAHLAPAAGPDYWNLPTEPWVYVIDAGGTVTARFEGVMGEDELLAAL